MPLIEHLIELRRRLLISFAAIAGVRDRRVHLLQPGAALPVRAVPGRDPQQPRAADRTGCKLIVTDPLAPFLVRLKISGYGGLALSVPIVMWQIWRFIVPGPATRTSGATRSGSSWSAIVLFAARLRRRLVHGHARPSTSCSASAAARSGPFIDANKYLTLVTLMFAAFGFAFEFPLLLVFLLLVGVVNTRQLRAQPALGGRRDHDLRGRHHPQPGSVLPIVHGRSHVHLLRGARSSSGG